MGVCVSEFGESFRDRIRSNEILGGIIATILAGVVGWLIGSATSGRAEPDAASTVSTVPTVTVTASCPACTGSTADLPPIGEEGGEWLKDLQRGDSGGTSRARDVRTDPVEVDGQLFENSVEMRCGDSKTALPGSNCWQEFILSRNYREFSATVGLLNDTPEGTRVRVAFFVDGRRLDSQTIESLGRDQAVPVQFSLVDNGSQANRLRIEIQFIAGEGYIAFGDANVRP